MQRQSPLPLPFRVATAAVAVPRSDSCRCSVWLHTPPPFALSARVASVSKGHPRRSRVVLVAFDAAVAVAVAFDAASLHVRIVVASVDFLINPEGDSE